MEGNVVPEETKTKVLNFINEYCDDNSNKWTNGYNANAYIDFIKGLKENLKHNENMYSLAEVFTGEKEAEDKIGQLFELAQKCSAGVKMLFQDESTKVFDEAFFGNVQISKATFDKIATKESNDGPVQDFQPSALSDDTKNYIKAICPETAKTYFAVPTDPMVIPQNNDNVEQETVVPQKSFFKSVKDFFDLPKVKAALWFTVAALSVVASVAAAIPTCGGSLFGFKLAGIAAGFGISEVAAIAIGTAAIAGGVAGVVAAGYYGTENVKVAMNGYGELPNAPAPTEEKENTEEEEEKNESITSVTSIKDPNYKDDNAPAPNTNIQLEASTGGAPTPGTGIQPEASTGGAPAPAAGTTQDSFREKLNNAISTSQNQDQNQTQPQSQSQTQTKSDDEHPKDL